MVSVTDDKAKRHKNPDHICLCLQFEIASEQTKSSAFISVSAELCDTDTHRRFFNELKHLSLCLSYITVRFGCWQ